MNRFAALFCLALSLPAAAAVDVITENTGANIRATYDNAYTGVVDTRIDAANATTNYEADGAGFVLQAVRYNGASDVQKTIIEFDLSNLPGSATITDAQLSLMSENIGMSQGDIAVYRVLQAAVLTQTTWNVYSTGNSWATAGANSAGTDRESTADDTNTAVDTATGTEEFWDVTSAVSAAYGEAATEVILLLEYTGTTDFVGHGFSNSSDTDGVRPELAITYTTGGGTAIPTTLRRRRD